MFFKEPTHVIIYFRMVRICTTTTPQPGCRMQNGSWRQASALAPAPQLRAPRLGGVPAAGEKARPLPSWALQGFLVEVWYKVGSGMDFW